MREDDEAALPRFRVRAEEDEILGVLRAAQGALFEHPIAAQALFRALVAEGRRYACTPEGARWQEALRGSELVRRARVVWEVGTLNTLEEDPEVVVPTKVLDAITRAAARDDLEPWLTRLFGLEAP